MRVSDEKFIAKCISIGLCDDLSLEKRKNLIFSDFSVNNSLFEKNISAAEKVLKWLEESDENKIWFAHDSFYPVFEPVDRRVPYFLLCKGKIPDLQQPCIGIVGTRRCNYEALQQSFALGLEAAANGICVVSGLAEGCDQAAAYGSLSFDNKTSCIGVLGCGLDVSYPAMTCNLKKRIVDQGGCLISRFLPGTPPLRYNFPSRNLIISALSNAVVAVQAPMKSGTLITADFALQMGKDVYVASSGNRILVCSKGTFALVSEGAPVITSLNGFAKCSKKVVPSEKGIRFGSCFYSLKDINSV